MPSSNRLTKDSESGPKSVALKSDPNPDYDKNFQLGMEVHKQGMQDPAEYKKQYLQGLLNKAKSFLSIFVVLSVIIGAGIFSGLDKYILPASIRGTVVNKEGFPVPLAALTIEPQQLKTESNSQGEFKIEGLYFGAHTIKVEAKDYEPYTTNVELKRLERKLIQVRLNQVDYAIIRGSLSLKTGQLNTSQIELKAGEQSITVDDKGNFESGKISLSTKQLVLKSSIYKDVIKDLNLLPGKNDLGQIGIEEGRQQKLKLVDWAHGESLVGLKMQIGAQAFTSNQDGEIVINSDKIEDKKYRIEFPNYLLKEGQLSDKDAVIEVLPAGKIIYTSEKSGSPRLYSSNYDGSQQLPISHDKGKVSQAVLKNDQVLFESDTELIKNEQGELVPQVYSVGVDGGNIQRISDLKGYKSDYKNGNSYWENDYLDLQAGKVAHLEHRFSPKNTSKIIVSDLDGSNKNVVRDRDYGIDFTEPVNQQLFSPTGDKIAYVLYRSQVSPFQFVESRILVVDKDGSNPVTVLSSPEDRTANSLQLIGFDRTSKYLLFMGPSGVTQEVFVFNLETKTMNKVAGLSNIAGIGYGSEKNLIYFSSRIDNKTDVYTLNFDTLEIKRITNMGRVSAFYVDSKTNIVYIGQDSEIYAVRQGREPEKINISSNLAIWRQSLNGLLGHD
jgi:hypothetical protein